MRTSPHAERVGAAAIGPARCFMTAEVYGVAECKEPPGRAEAVDSPHDVRGRSPGGGGVGDPLDREIEKVQEDALNEYISINTAKNVYGVIIDPETFDVDYDATQKLRRRKMRAKKAKQTK